LTQEALAQAVAQELAQAFPDWPQPLWHKVIAEKRATFACTPALSRPAQRTPRPNFYLAGDYTAGDYPATIEGAVRSGVLCARMILTA
ncbi:MAG TPA: FAD-dependent oxidoreductase, partial [Rhodocyclaceae bacterium]|nr:FAD-dependent oxidoreductase [Rhodocyclaceae bacterium]